MKLTSINKVAESIYSNLELKTRNDGTEFYSLKDDISWQRDIIYKAHLDRLPDDTIYSKINDFCELLADLDDDATEDDAMEVIYNNSDADIYTSNLTSWLNEDNNNVYYLTEVLEEMQITDGFQALSMAQSRFFEEIGIALIGGINEYLNS